VEKKLSYSIPEVSRETGLGKTTVYKAITEGRLRARKFGNRTIILADDLDQFLNSLPELNGNKAVPAGNLSKDVAHEH
jgi:excisionase family DNA binding protein